MAFFDNMTQVQLLLLYLAVFAVAIVWTVIETLLVAKFPILKHIDFAPMILLGLFGGGILAIVYWRWLQGFGADATDNWGIVALLVLAIGCGAIASVCLKISDIFESKRK